MSMRFTTVLQVAKTVVSAFVALILGIFSIALGPAIRKLFGRGGDTMLHIAAMKNDHKIVESIIYAIEHQDARAFEGIRMQFLDKYGHHYSRLKVGSIESKDSEKCTPLHLAARWNSIAVVRLLLGHGANTHAINARGGTPRDESVYMDNIEIAKELSANMEVPFPADDAKLAIINRLYKSPEHIVGEAFMFLENKNVDLALRLIKRWKQNGPEIEVKMGSTMWSPLQLAVSYAGDNRDNLQLYEEVVIALLKLGSSLSYLNERGETARDVAVDKGIASFFDKACKVALVK